MNANEMILRPLAEKAEKLAEQAEKRDDYKTARTQWNVAAGLWREIGWGPSAKRCETRAVYA